MLIIFTTSFSGPLTFTSGGIKKARSPGNEVVIFIVTLVTMPFLNFSNCYILPKGVACSKVDYLKSLMLRLNILNPTIKVDER